MTRPHFHSLIRLIISRMAQAVRFRATTTGSLKGKDLEARIQAHFPRYLGTKWAQNASLQRVLGLILGLVLRRRGLWTPRGRCGIGRISRFGNGRRSIQHWRRGKMRWRAGRRRSWVRPGSCSRGVRVVALGRARVAMVAEPAGMAQRWGRGCSFRAGWGWSSSQWRSRHRALPPQTGYSQARGAFPLTVFATLSPSLSPHFFSHCCGHSLAPLYASVLWSLFRLIFRSDVCSAVPDSPFVLPSPNTMAPVCGSLSFFLQSESS